MLEKIHCPSCGKVIGYKIKRTFVCVQHKDGRSKRKINTYFTSGYVVCICDAMLHVTPEKACLLIESQAMSVKGEMKESA